MPDATLYLKCQPGDIAPLVLLSGDPARVERVGTILDTPHTISHNREFSVITGSYRGTPVSVASGGIGAPSTAIALEEMAQLGVKVVVRIGTMMGIHAPLESVVIPTAAARFEGTSDVYLPPAYPAVADWSLAQSLADAGRQHKLDIRLGMTATYDAFYPEMAPSLVDRGQLDLALPRRAGVLSMDMETSLIFVVGAVLGIAAAAMCLVTVQAEPHTHLEANTRAALDDRMVHAALDGLVAYEPAALAVERKHDHHL